MTSKDSPEALAFLAVFNRLKTLIDGDPANILPDAPTLRGPDTLIAPADPVFIRASRDYEDNYATTVFAAVFADSVWLGAREC